MFWEGQTAVLERVASGDPLEDILHDIVVLIEGQAKGMLCSLVLLDQRNGVVRCGAAPSLPAEYVAALDGLAIGPTAGSCGAAAYLRERVIVEDIATHPNWQRYRYLALPYGLRACWSSPIFSPEREVLGTFAMYYRTPRGPSAEEISWVDAATHLAAIAIVSDRARRSLQRSEARARNLARLYAMSSAVNEAMVRERDAGKLRDSACRIAVEHGMARLAWIGLLDRATKTIAPVAHAGVGFEKMSAIHGDIDFAAPVVHDDIEKDTRLSWGPAAVALGLRACAVIPMKYGATTAGVLVLYSDRPEAFGDEETKVLVTLAEDIAFAIDSARTAAALRASEERLGALIERTPDVAVQWYDDAGHVLFYNGASRRLFGWTEKGALGKKLVDLGFWDAGEEARFAEARAAAIQGKSVAPTEFRYRRGDGVDGHLLSTVFRIPLSATEHCTVCMDVDLTEHHRMQAAIQAGEALRASIYDSVTDVIFYLAVEDAGRYRFESVNRTFLSITGLQHHDVVGKLIDEVIPAPSLALVKSKYAEAISTARRVTWDEVSRYPSGTKYGQVAVSPIFDVNGRCTHLVGTVHDITERRAAEDEQRQVEEQLSQAQRLQALGTLAGGIAHDFNNILAAVNCNVEVALLHSSDETARECLLEVQQAAVRATSLVRQILTFGRQSQPRPEVLDLRPVVEEALALTRVTIPSTTTVTTSFATDTPRVLADATQVHQAVLNLVTNATHAIGERPGEIDIRIERCVVRAGERRDAPEMEGVHARIVVHDNGPGIDEETLKRIFEPFFTTKAAGHGTGLGLSVVHGVMKAHGGLVRAESVVGTGTTFELLFPAIAEDRVAPSPSKAPAPRLRVLFVDDDEALVFLARRAFARRGHAISAFERPVEALEAFRRSPNDFDIVVTDLSMPQLDGGALIHAIRSIRPDVRVVLTTGFVRPQDAALARDLAVSHVLEKPQSVDDLARLVEEWASKG